MAADELVAGRLIAQRYQLERLLGEGGMGAVWSATHVVTKKRVALKFLKANAASSPSHVRRFLREARAASAVRHPNVVEIHDIVELENGAPAMVMDLLLGESLAERLARQRPVELGELSRLLLPVISAVGTAHSLGIVHRDIKPDNVFLERNVDGSIVPRILDFGIAKLSAQEGAAAETATLTRTGSVMGTPYYMAPEQVFGESDVDQRADVWAFGVILYEALSGRRPIDGENFGQLFKAIATGNILPLEQVAPFLPADVTNLVGRMLSKEKQQRPQDLREVFEVLRRYADVNAASFEGARPDLEALRDESAAAYAPTQTPNLTPADFAQGRGGTALLSSSGAAAAQSESDAAFARTDDGTKGVRALFKWLALAAGVTVVGLAAASLFGPPDASEPSAASGSAWADGAALASVAATVAPAPSPLATPLASAPPAPSAAPAPSSAGAAAPTSLKPRGGARAAAPATKGEVAPPPAVAPPAPAAASTTKLPGGIAPNAPF